MTPQNTVSHASQKPVPILIRFPQPLHRQLKAHLNARVPKLSIQTFTIQAVKNLLDKETSPLL
jgi:hypothetical protein